MAPSSRTRGSSWASDRTRAVYSSAYGAAPTTTRGRRAAEQLVAGDDEVDMVLGLEASHHEVVALPHEAELLEPIEDRLQLHRGAVGDLTGGRAELRGVVVGDPLRVGDQRVGVPHGRLLGPSVVGTPGTVPLVALPLEPVDVHRHRHAASVQDRDERRVRGIEHECRVGMVQRASPDAPPRARCGTASRRS